MNIKDKETETPVSIQLTTQNTEVKTNQEFEVTVLVDNAGRQSTGADVLIQYDPEYLELQEKRPEQTKIASIQGNAVRNTLPNNQYGFQNYKTTYLDTAKSDYSVFPYEEANAEAGTIYFSAVSRPAEVLIGKKTIATLVFKAKKPGIGTIKIIFEKGLTNETNVALIGLDILEETKDVNIKIT